MLLHMVTPLFPISIGLHGKLTNMHSSARKRKRTAKVIPQTAGSLMTLFSENFPPKNCHLKEQKMIE